ncbi:MAG TPA: RNA polymerase sigma-54 factor [Cytophagales bacterium]|jgi:RNA polymerase sigma-54 factor|nr:RNA polymerase sigma-54 factor [Cytophagales bacterium]
MQKLGLVQSLQQKLSPQQIQFIKLLQIPTAELEHRIEEELEVNPALEEGRENEEDSYEESSEFEDSDSAADEDINFEEYLHDDYSGYKMQGDGSGDEEEKDMPLAEYDTLLDQLNAQLGFIKLNERQRKIGEQLIGSIESDGYIRRDLDAIINDLAFSQNIETDVDEVEEILRKIQSFDPAGIAARNLQECLLLQLERKIDHNGEVALATEILEHHFDDFTKKHYDKIKKKLGVEDDEIVKHAIETITKLNPKPGGSSGEMVKTQYLIPDFILINNNGKLELTLNSRNAPELRVSRSFSEMMDTYDKSKKKDKKLRETATFVKQKLDAAKWFIDAIKQRQHTLLNTMNAIAQFQYDFFLSGEESDLKPMILKDIAQEIQMDISTVSRVVNSKSVQTEFGIFPLKYFFSEAISTQSGDDVSSREVKSVLKGFIEAEDKKKPLSDDKLEKLLKDKGYKIARRTVAKYREQMGIPVARLRKEF